MENLAFNSAQNIINMARELNISIPEAQALAQRAMQGVKQGPLDMLIKPYSQQASNDAYKQIVNQVAKKPASQSTLGQFAKGLGGKALGAASMMYGMYDAGNSMNRMYQQSLMNNLLKGIQFYDNYMIEPSRKQ
nr:MAG TPA: hypothetical protein [Caudoviricetes sp.]